MATTGTLSSGSDFIGLNDALKHVYEPAMANQAVTESELWDLFTQQEGFEVSEGPDGKQINLSHIFAAGGGAGFMNEDDYLYSATNPTIKQSSLTIKQAMVPVELSGRTLRRVKAGPAAFATWADEALPLAVERLAFHKDRALMGAGTGIVCRINDASPATTDTGIDSAYGVAGLDGAEFLLLEGDSTRWGPNANGSSLRTGAAVVAAVDYENVEIDIDAVPTSGADNDYVFIGDANVNGSGTRESMGLLGIVDDGTIVSTFQGLARATYPRMKAQIVAADTAQGGQFGGILSEDLLEYADRIAWQRGKGKPDVIVTSYSGHASFWKSLKGDRRINDPAGAYRGGVRSGGLSITLGDRDVVLRKVRKCPQSLAFMLTKSSLKMYAIGAGRWDDTDGSIWNRVINSTGRKDAFFAVFVEEYNVASSHPNRNVKITGLVAA